MVTHERLQSSLAHATNAHPNKLMRMREPVQVQDYEKDKD
jgi:hypothetical protein